jgi:hypothetical protein
MKAAEKIRRPDNVRRLITNCHGATFAHGDMCHRPPDRPTEIERATANKARERFRSFGWWLTAGAGLF